MWVSKSQKCVCLLKEYIFFLILNPWLGIASYHMERVLITSQDINKFSKNIKSKKKATEVPDLPIRLSGFSFIPVGKRKVSRKNKCVQLKWQLSKLYMWDRLCQNMFSPIKSLKLYLMISHPDCPAVRSTTVQELEFQPSCWLVLLHFLCTGLWFLISYTTNKLQWLQKGTSYHT